MVLRVQAIVFKYGDNAGADDHASLQVMHSSTFLNQLNQHWHNAGGDDPNNPRHPVSSCGNPQMWDRAHVGFGPTGRRRKGSCTKQCAWRKHGSCDTRVVEPGLPKKYRVEEMRPMQPFWKHRAPKMRLVVAQCAHRKHCYPETPSCDCMLAWIYYCFELTANLGVTLPSCP